MTTYGPWQVTVVNIHDGDTLDVDIPLIPRAGRVKVAEDLGFNIWRTPQGVKVVRQSVRLYGCNAAELATDEGKKALAYLETLVHVGDVVTLLSHDWDKYGGRIDGSITLADGRDLTTVMVMSGYAAWWDGKGPKPTPAGG